MPFSPPRPPQKNIIYEFLYFTSTSSLIMFQPIVLNNLKENYLTKLKKVSKNLISGLILVRLAQAWAHKTFCEFYLY